MASKSRRRDPTTSLVKHIKKNSKLDVDTGCRLWTGTLIDKGYGRISVDGEQCLVHRVLWEKVKGPIPKGMCVCHKCDVRNCVNLDHLFLGTIRDNNRDKARKGRCGCRFGEDHQGAKLTEDDVVDIRRSNDSYRVIGRRFGIDKKQVYNIKQRVHWSHVP